MGVFKKLFSILLCIFTIIFTFTWVNNHLRMPAITVRGRMMRYVAIKQHKSSNNYFNRSKVKAVPGPFQESTSPPRERDSLRFHTIPDKEVDSLRNIAVKLNDPGIQSPGKAKDSFEGQMTCKLPKIDPFDKEVLPFIKHPRRFECKKIQEEFSYIERELIYLNKTVFENYKKKTKRRIKCFWKYLFKKEGHKNGIKNTKLAKLTAAEPIKFPSSGMVQVECFVGKKGKRKHVYFNVHVQTQPIKEPLQKPTEDELSVYMLIFESMATARFKRHMKSIDKLLKERQTFFFDGYTKVADNTYVNLVPMLTGLRANNGMMNMKDEFHRKYRKINSFDEVEDFIWKSFSRKNYTTAFFENAVKLSTFGYGKKVGFKSAKPFDYFYRPYFLQHKVLSKHSTKYCFGNEPFVSTQMKLAHNLFDWYGNKQKLFVVNILTEPGHGDENDIERADDLIADSLRKLFSKNSFNRTLIFLMGDHGPRYGDVRLTRNGYFEERLTFLSVVTPPWFHTKYPNLTNKMKVNQKRLATPFDVHQTLKDILEGNYRGGQLKYKTQRGISLFDEIPWNRTCTTAGIPQLYCPCYNKPKETVIDTPLSKKLADIMVQHINLMLSKRKLNVKCATLKLDSIRQVTLMNENGDEVLYKVLIRATPGGGLFEGLVTKNKDSFSIPDGAVSRLNLYGRQGKCIKSGFQKYCYCNEQ
ncbi:uncharacterized protein [Clytia hemisphaerica]|uniref:Uncharacterized protein n=1 Tax=Clytia hemisphaerica TaxID=252671 RepID=A0A7M5X4S6_9CNID